MIHQGQDDSVLVSMLAYLYPLSFLYYSLYYTDTGSVCVYLLTLSFVQYCYYQRYAEIKEKKVMVIHMWQHVVLCLVRLCVCVLEGLLMV